MIQKAEHTNGDVGVVLCDCGGTLRKQIDFAKIQKHLEQMPSVAKVSCCSEFCRQSQCSKAIRSALKKNVSRLVIAACDAGNFDGAMRKAVAAGAVNDGLLWCVNIREHCAWVAGKTKAATDKAIDILAAGVRRVGLAEPVESKKTSVSQDVLVLGSGVAAMQTAVGLSKLGHQVTLATKGHALGGMTAKAPQLYAYLATKSCDAQALVESRVDELIEQVNSDKRICVQVDTALKSIDGEFGNFTAVLGSDSTEQAVSAGAIVLATGAAPSPLAAELAQLINNGTEVPKRIAIVTDILGEQGRAVSGQVLSAAELLVSRFGAEVKLYCHSVRVAAMGAESLYRRARQTGVVIVKYESPPVISDEGDKKTVCVEEPMIGRQVCEEFDVVIAADAPAVDSQLLNLIEGLRAGPDGALQCDNVWLLPTKTNREGIFVAGSARGNSELRDAQVDGLAAANHIHELLKDKKIEVFDDAAAVDNDKCVLCLTCMRICPHGAISIDVDSKAASVSPVGCQRCGICAAQCPAEAIELPRYTEEQVSAEIGICTEGQNSKIKTVVFACENSAYPAATAAGINGSGYPGDIRLIRVPCAGKVDPRQVLRALECGAQKVLILSCHPENCQYIAGSSRAEKRIARLNNILAKAGVDKKRVVFGPLASVEPSKFLEYVKE